MFPDWLNSDNSSQPSYPFSVEPQKRGLRENFWLGSQMPAGIGSFEPFWMMKNTALQKERYNEIEEGDVIRWAYHPDPRVPLWIMDTWDERYHKWLGGRGKIFSKQLRQRSLQQLQRHEEIWGVLLDQYLSRQIFHVEKERASSRWGAQTPTRWPTLKDLPEPIQVQLQKVGRWIEKQKQPEPITQLMEFDYWGLRAVALRHSPQVSERGEKWLQEGKTRAEEQSFLPAGAYLDLGKAGARNPHATNDFLQTLIEEFPQNNEILFRVATHPNANAHTQQIAARHFTGGDDDELIAQMALHPRLQDNPEAAKEIARVASFELLCRMLTETDNPQQQYALIEVGTSRNASLLVGQMKRHTQLPDQLPPQSLQPLLEHDDSTIRTEALRMTGQMSENTHRTR